MANPIPKERAKRNRTMSLDENEREVYARDVGFVSGATGAEELEGRILNQDALEAVGFLPGSFVDLLVIDPPYNLDKTFNSSAFKKMPIEEYGRWFERVIEGVLPSLKETASVYVCSEWYSSSSVHNTLEKYFKVRNRITWEREKGRGAKANWKNASEDIWFATVSNDYTFNVDAVKLRRRVVAPYTDSDGEPKDWERTSKGQFRLTHPSNLWGDITVPFWSMGENTDHPTQKPEKLMAKLILASSNEGDIVFDPFMGAGTTVVTAKKLGRRYLGIEADMEYCLLAAKRLSLAEDNKVIQGYHDGVFWERNSLKTAGGVNGQ